MYVYRPGVGHQRQPNNPVARAGAGDCADAERTPAEPRPGAVAAYVTSRHEARRRETRAKLIAAAGPIFIEKGLRGASLEEICAAAGLTRGAFYSNFSSKAELLYAVLGATRENAVDQVRAHGEAAEGVEGVLDAEGLYDFGGPRFRSHFMLQLEAVLHGARHEEYRPMSQALKRAHLDALEELLRQLEAKGAGRLRLPAREGAALCVALVDGLSNLALIFDDVTYAERVPEAMLMLGPVLFTKRDQEPDEAADVGDAG